MTSREMADLTEKRHDSVKRTIDMLAERGVISNPQIVDGIRSANGIAEKTYRVGERDIIEITKSIIRHFNIKLVDGQVGEI
jgi:phage regulator Rha-like protein